MKKFINFTLFACLMCVSCTSYSQNFTVFYLSSRYDISDRDIMANSRLFQKYYWVGEAVLTPNRDGVLDKKNIIQWIEKSFPDVTNGSYLGIDIEGEVMKSLREGKEGSEEFESAKMVFIEAIDLIKSTRPSLKVGVYGLPFRIYYQNQYKGDDTKLYPILKRCDFISPALYMIFPDSERGAKSNDDYIKFNLTRALMISKDLDIPVLPYVWPIIHPMNKRHGGKMIDGGTMGRYLNLVKNWEYAGRKASGVLWWEESKNSVHSTYKKGRILQQGAAANGSSSTNPNIIIESTKALMK